MKKIISAIIVAILLVTSAFPIQAFAADTSSEKEEVVYGLLGTDGTVNNLYVVNIFNGGKITDYGNYSKVQNLTTSEDISQKGDEISIDTTADKLYYQGTLESKELPWNITIKYILDGKEITGTDLAGKSGALQIKMSVTQNTKVDSTFYDNYALQIMLKLDTKLCSNMKADNATVADAGSSKQFNYIMLPGKGADITVTADVHDFEMDEITINGIKMVLDMDINYDEFTGGINQLVDAIKGLDNGAGDLLNGSDQLKNGMEKYIAGMKAYKEGILKLDGGVDKLNTGAAALSAGLSKLSMQNDSLVKGASAFQKSTFDTVNGQLAAEGVTLPVLTPDNYSAVLANIPNLATIKTQLDNVMKFTQGLKSYTGGVSQLSVGASNLAKGTSQLKDSTSLLVASANTLYNAGFELNSAIKKLRDGIATYKEGTNELRSGTSDIDTEISNKIDEFVNSTFGNGDEVISFVSEKNQTISNVQFVLKTDTIKQQKADDTESVQAIKLSFWQKLLKLFGLYK